MNTVAVNLVTADRAAVSASPADTPSLLDIGNEPQARNSLTATNDLPPVHDVIDKCYNEAIHPPYPNSNYFKRIWSLLYSIISNITLEPVLFLHTFALMVTQPVFSFMMMNKLCRQSCGYTAEQCEAYGTGKNATLDTEVEKVWAQFDNYSTIIGTVPVILYALFMGPWSDVFGRKKPMAVSFVGIIASNVMTLLLYFIPALPIGLLLLPNLFSSMTGGLTSLMVSACAYAADISHTSASRTIRFALYDISLSFGASIGGILSGALIASGMQYYVCYSISLASTIAGLIIVLIRVHDTPGMVEQVRRSSLWGAVKSLFTIKHIAESYKTLTKPRSGRTRRCIWLTMLVFLFVFTTEQGESQLLQKFYTNAPLRWSLSFFIFYTSIFEFGCMAGALIFVPVVKKVFFWRDTSFVIVSCVCRIIYCYGLAVMNTPWQVYFFSVFDMLDYGAIIGPRCIISKLVADDEQGKMLSLYAVTEALCPLFGTLAGTAIFTATAGFWPGFFGIAEAYTMLGALGLVVLVDYYIRRDEQAEAEMVARDGKINRKIV